MSTETNIAAVCREFTDALTEVLAETAAVSPVRRGRLARAHAAFKRHPGYSEYEFCAAVETAFTRWELLQNAALSRAPGTQIVKSRSVKFGRVKIDSA